jgi:hypothetical protein
MTDTSADELPAELEIEFDPPLAHNNGTWDRITLREPKAIEVKKARSLLKGQFGAEQIVDHQIMLVALVSGVPRVVVENMPIRKLNQATEYLMAFVDGVSGPLVK